MQYKSTYFIEDTCQCMKWKDCKWSIEAYNNAKTTPKESEDFKKIQFAFQSYHCGDPNDRTVYCCGLDQRPPENVQHFNTGKQAYRSLKKY